MNEILPVPGESKGKTPVYDATKQEWYNIPLEQSLSAQKAQATYTAFMMTRFSKDPKPSWTQLNQEHSSIDPTMTTVGHLPVIQAPADGEHQL